jgi:AraC-like DNA-binding protein
MGLVLPGVDLPASAGEVVYPPRGRLGPRLQRDVQLVLVHAGSARVTVDGASRAVLGSGTVGLLLPGHREHFAFDDRAATRHAWVQVRLAPPSAAELAWLRGLPPALPASAALIELVGEAVAAARTPLSTAAPLLATLACAAIWRYAGEAEWRVRGAGEPVARARAYPHAHLAEPDLDLARIADAAHVTPAHLVRRFGAELGVTPMAYLWQRRVAVGVDLLAHTGLPVGDIARRAGFKSIYHFSRRVKRQTGRSPTQLRRDRWTNA